MKFLTSALLLTLALNANANNHVASKPTAPFQPVAIPIITLTKDNMLNLSTYVDETSTARLATQAKELDSRLKSNEALYLLVNSGGGGIDYGLEMIENLQSLNRPVHTISMWSASMAFHTVQGLGNRYVLANGTLMTHKAKGGFEGEFPGQLDQRYSYYLRRIFRMDEGVVARTRGKHTLNSYQALYENEYWCDGADCIKQGFADRVVKATCDKSLEGTKEEVEKLMFFGVPIEIVLIVSKCPLVTGVIDYKIVVDGKQLFSKDKDKKPDGKSYYDNESLTSKFDKQTLVLMHEKIQERINSRTQKKVIKGY